MPTPQQLASALLNPSNDYDYNAAIAAGVQQAANGHWPDTYKLPNHMTFSDQSIYSGQNGMQGGQWAQLPNNQWMFTPGPTNYQFHTPQDLQNYFQQVEPDSILRLVPGGGM